MTVDHDYVETLGLHVIKGRDFSKEYSTDKSSAFLINSSTAQKMGWDNPVGKEITLQFYVEEQVEKKGKIVGMVEDFQYHSLHNSINPVLLHIYNETFYHDYLTVRFSTDRVQNIIAGIEQKWKDFNPSRPFEYRFLDDTFDQMYRSEQQLCKVFNLFALIAVLVACLGLFGLASYSTEQRIKEIGIRKVLRAKVSDILGLLSKDFLKLVMLGFLIAIPISFYLVQQWLDNYARHIDVGFGIFLFVGVVAVAVAMVAVGYQSLRAALVNPVESIRSE